MIKTIDVECNAANPNLPLKPMFAFVNSPSSIRVRNVPKRIGDWCIRKVYFTAVYPDSTVKTAECVLTGGVWVGTIEGTNTSGTSTNGYTIFADGTDENGNNVTGYVLGKGDIEILEADGTLSPDPARYTVKLLSAEATQPREGDMYPTDDGYVIWQNGQANLLGTPFEQITAYVDSAISSKADLSAIPSNTSQLSNDSGFITSAEIEPYHNLQTPTVNTGIAKRAYSLALCNTHDGTTIVDAEFQAQYTTDKDLTDIFTAIFLINTYWPYNMTKYGEQTYDPALELKFCQGTLSYMSPRGPKQIYSGYMFRTKGAGFAMPCSEDGTPAGTLYEITSVGTTTILVSRQTPHTIGFTSIYKDPYGQITSLDGQEGTIFVYRNSNLKTKTVGELVANKSELPTKTSDLTNDSGFITSADIITKRDLNDLNIYVDPMADMTTTKFTVVVSYAGDPSTPLFTVELTYVGGEDSRWEYSPSGSNQSISIDYYSNTGTYHLSYLNIQDGGGNKHSGGMDLQLTSPYWTGEAQDDWFHFSVTSQTTTITTKAYVDSLIAALEARIAALEGN